MYIIMLGGPGSGKGSVGGKISEDLKLPHIATGDIFRAELKNETELGKKIKKYMDNGLLVPDEVVIEIVENRLSQDDAKNGAVLDGFPRTKEQAIALDKFLAGRNQKVNAAIELDVSDEDIVKRIVKRVVCSNKDCGESFNTEFKPPKVEGICDKCGSKLTKRADDTREKLQLRLDTFFTQTQPVIDFYAKKGIVRNEEVSVAINRLGVDAAKDIVNYIKNK